MARNAEGLKAAAQEVKEVNPDIQVLTQAMDIRSADEVKALFSRIESEIGMVDVLVNNAASGKSALPVREVDPNDFWYDFVSIPMLSSSNSSDIELQEVNVKGTLLMSQEFLKFVGKEKPATIINISSAGGIAIIPSTSSYSLTKLVQIQIQRFIAAENPNITAISMHPGAVMTPITKPQFVKFSKDTYALAGGVAVWLATDAAKFMNGRYMGANWAVDELLERKDEIVSQGLLLPELQGKFGKAQFES